MKKTISARTSISNCQIIDEKDGMHRSPLHLAARYNQIKVVETLVREYAAAPTAEDVIEEGR